jgi:translation initiation factor IF-1
VAVVVVNTAAAVVAVVATVAVAAGAVAAVTKPLAISGGVRVTRTPLFLSRSIWFADRQDVLLYHRPALLNQSMKEEHIEVEGRVTLVLPGTMFRVELDNKHLVLATICGKMRKRWVRLTVGDRVKMEMSPYDLNKARITWRLR